MLASSGPGRYYETVVSDLRETTGDELTSEMDRGCPVLNAADDAMEAASQPPQANSSSFRRGLFIGLGLFFVAIGGIGIFVPGLPTTVFLIAASYFFSRSSARLRDWLWSRPVLGESLRRISRGERAPLRTRVLSLASMWIMITITSVLGAGRGLSTWVLVTLVVAGLIGTYYLTLWSPGRRKSKRQVSES